MSRKNDPDSNNMPNLFRLGGDGQTYDNSLSKGRDTEIGRWFAIPKTKYPEWVNTPEKRKQWESYWETQLNWWLSEMDQCKRNREWGNGPRG